MEKKLSYKEFKDVVIEKFMDYMPEDYHDMQVKVMPIGKTNQIKDGLNLVKVSEEAHISPTLYVNDMYEHYLEVLDVETTLRSAADTMIDAMKKIPAISSEDYDNAKDNIVFQLINTAQNQELLKHMPHRQYLDLSIVYRWLLKKDENGIYGSPVNNRLAEKLGLQEKQLFKLAVENTRRILPPVVKNMDDIVREVMIKQGADENLVNSFMKKHSIEESMYVISNDKRIYGAACMLYEDVLHNLAESIGTDLYIMPSSVHEVIAISCNEVNDPYDLAKMVADINVSDVELDIRLSNQVYYYDKDLRGLTLATDTPNKRLDGKN